MNGGPVAGAPTGPLLPLALLALIVVYGALLRVPGLDREPLSEEELNHIAVATSLEEGSGPLLPSGVQYTRAVDYSRMVQLSMRHVPGVARAARLPSALFGVIGLVLMAVVSWRIAGPWAAVGTTLLLAVFPEAVAESRRARFYTLQLAWCIVALLAAWEVSKSTSDPARRSLYAALLVVAFVAAGRLQVTTLSAVAAVGVIAAAVGIADLRSRGRVAWARSVPLQITAAGLVGAIGLALLRPELPRLLFDIALCRGPSCAGVRPDPTFYLRQLFDAFPVVVAASPLAFGWVALRRPRLGVFLAVWFWLPFVLYSAVFPRQSVRFLFPALPALFLAAGIAGAFGAAWLYRMLAVPPDARGTLPPGPWQVSRRRVAAGVAVGAIAFAATLPALDESRAAPGPDPTMDWAAAGAFVRAAGGGSRVPLGTSHALPPLYYWGRVDFSVGADYLPRALAGPPEGPGTPPLEPYSGRPILSRPEEILAAFPQADSILIVVGEDKLHSGAVDERLAATLQGEAEELCGGGCEGLRVYLWRRGYGELPHEPLDETLAVQGGGIVILR